jgi:hypothetical protein
VFCYLLVVQRLFYLDLSYFLGFLGAGSVRLGEGLCCFLLMFFLRLRSLLLLLLWVVKSQTWVIHPPSPSIDCELY